MRLLEIRGAAAAAEPAEAGAGVTVPPGEQELILDAFWAWQVGGLLPTEPQPTGEGWERGASWAPFPSPPPGWPWGSLRLGAPLALTLWPRLPGPPSPD